MATTTKITATCHCKAARLAFTVPTDTLPLPAYFCHCNTCRRSHGTLCIIHAQIPAPEVDLSPMTAYKSPETTERYFCSTCGAHMLDKAIESDKVQWYLAISVADAEEKTWNIDAHFYVDSTRDGGLSVWMPSIRGKTLDKWSTGTCGVPGSTSDGTPTRRFVGRDSERPEEKLKAQCLCGGVEFYIARPRGPEAYGGMPDNMIPADKTKWYALNDVCTSCRLVSGCAIVSWAFPEISHINLPDGSPYRPVFGTLKAYESSPGISRTFCGTCGALVTYSCGEWPNHVDVGVGLLDAVSGARAEEWLEWRVHRASYEEDCEWGSFLQALKSGMQSHAKSE